MEGSGESTAAAAKAPHLAPWSSPPSIPLLLPPARARFLLPPPPPFMTHRRRRPPRIAVESVLIVFSILLALAVNAWWSGRQDRVRVAQALVYLDAEVLSNRDRVRGVLPYHRELHGIFIRVLAGEVESSNQGLQEAGFQGFRPPGLVRAAWEAALAGGVPGLMPFEDVSLLGEVYSWQDRVHRLSVDGLAAMLGPGAFNPDNFQSLMTQALGHTTDVILAQEELLGRYDAWILHRGLEP